MPTKMRFETDKNRQIPLLDQTLSSLQVECLRHGLFHGDDSWSRTFAPEPFHRLYFYLKGPNTNTIRCGNDLITLRPQTVAWLPANRVYQVKADGPFEKWYIHLRVSVFSKRDILTGKKTPMAIYPFKKIQSLIQSFSEPAKGLFKIKAALLEITGQYLADYAPDLDLRKDYLLHQRYEKWLTRAQYAPFREWDFTAWAREENRSLASISRSFQRDFGLSLKDYFHEELIRRASEMITSSQDSILAIALRLGMNHENYLIRLFKKKMWCTPLQWRDRNRLDQDLKRDRHH